MTLNEIRFVETGRPLNAIERGGPIRDWPRCRCSVPAVSIDSGKWSLSIDEANGAPDGFAIDFEKVVENRLRKTSGIGSDSNRGDAVIHA